jgi:hypothetical protein
MRGPGRPPLIFVLCPSVARPRRRLIQFAPSGLPPRGPQPSSFIPREIALPDGAGFLCRAWRKLKGQ